MILTELAIHIFKTEGIAICYICIKRNPEKLKTWMKKNKMIKSLRRNSIHYL